METSASSDILKIAFLHEKLAKRKCDRYLLNLACAYHNLGHKVTFYTSQYDRSETIDDFKFLEKINVYYTGWWIPKSIFGLFRQKMSSLKAVCMAIRMLFLAPEHKPSLIILDVNMIALYLLHYFSKYRLFYVESLTQLRKRPDFCEHVKYNPSLLEAKFIKLADEIIVESVAYVDIFKRSFPAVTKDPIVLYPAIDIGVWNEENIHIQRIVPDLLDNSILFLSIGKYRRSSNFKLALDAFEVLLQIISDIETTKRFQLVIAGNCKTLEEKLYYTELTSLANEKTCSSQVTFLKQLPIIHEKTLIMEAAFIIYPPKSELQADFLLKAMSLGKPIVATNKGMASKILQNRISGVTTEPDPMAMAQVLRKLIANSHMPSFMGEIARDVFQKNYSFKSFCAKVNDITANTLGLKQVQDS